MMEDRIIFRFTREEVSALLKVLGLTELPGLGIRAETPRQAACLSLVEAGLVMICGERTLVDRVISAVLSDAAFSRQSLCAHAPNMDAALYRGARMYVDIAIVGEWVRVEPLPDLRGAKGALLRALSDAREFELTLRDGDRYRRESGDARALKALLEEMEEAEV